MKDTFDKFQDKSAAFVWMFILWWVTPATLLALYFTGHLPKIWW